MRNFDVDDLISLCDGLEYANLELAVVSEIIFVFFPYKDLPRKSMLRSATYN